MLTTTRSVLPRSFESDGCWVFEEPDEDGYQHPAVAIPYEKWNDLGQPDQVTITIEPGDTLN